MIKIAVFASGSGTNAANLIQYFESSRQAKVAMVVCNKPEAGVVNVAHRHRVPLVMVSKRSWQYPEMLLHTLQSEGIGFIALAGFLWKIPSEIIEAYQGRIVNLHPSLLPDFGGKGMYGAHVHQAVIVAGKKESGISIHHVNEAYDEGDVIARFTCQISETDTPDTLAKRIHELEYRHYPEVIASLLLA